MRPQKAKRGGWFSWKVASEREGEEALLEMVRAGTVKARRHPNLPPNSAIEWPRNQQVKLSQEVFSSKRKTTDEDTTTDTTQMSDESQAEFMQKFKAQRADHAHKCADSTHETSSPRGGAAASSSRGGAAASSSGSSVREHVKVAIASVRKAHSMWDKARREFVGLVSKSEKHPNTKGSAFERDLATFIAEGGKLDTEMMELETHFLEAGDLSDHHVKEGARLSTALHSLIKEGQKRASALKPWFKVAVASS